MSRQVDVKALVSHIVRGDGSDRCRICMGDTSEGQVHLEDTVMMDGDKPVTLAELLEVITGVEVPLDDDLPLGLCSTCSVSAIDAATFRTLCRKSSLQWETTVDLLTHIPTPTNGQKLTAYLNEDSLSITTENYIKPIPKYIQNKNDLDNVKTHKYKCPFCGKQFMYSHYLSLHLKESSDYVRACHICGSTMSREDLIAHLISSHDREPFDCKKCPAMFFSYKQYKLHLEKAHRHGVCSCGECGRRFKSQHAYSAHQAIHVSKTCPNCSELFRNQRCYYYHVKKCCNLNKERLDIHQTKTKLTVPIKTKNKNIKVGFRGSADSECYCDYCKRKFAGKKFVAAHIQIVHMKNTHKPCIYCGKFLAAARMTTHLKRHESTESYQCGYCGIILKTKLGYSQHVRLHTGERPYECKFCGQKFSASSKRSEHIRRVHENISLDSKYACELCPARFRVPYRLKKHVFSVHQKSEALLFECNVCKQKFGSCRGLLHHSRTHQEVYVAKKQDSMILEEVV